MLVLQQKDVVSLGSWMGSKRGWQRLNKEDPRTTSRGSIRRGGHGIGQPVMQKSTASLASRAIERKGEVLFD